MLRIKSQYAAGERLRLPYRKRIQAVQDFPHHLAATEATAAAIQSTLSSSCRSSSNCTGIYVDTLNIPMDGKITPSRQINR